MSDFLIKCLPGLKFETDYVSMKDMWKDLGDQAYADFKEQIETRANSGEFESREERGEYESDAIKKRKLENGLTGEWIAYYLLNRLCPGYLDPPMFEGASWNPDLDTKKGKKIRLECKTFRGQLRWNWRKEVDEIQSKPNSEYNVRKYYQKNAPGPFFQYADKNGVQSDRNTDPLFRGKCFHKNDFIVLLRSKVVYENNVKDIQYKISGIVKKNEVAKRLYEVFEDIDDSRFYKSKKRLCEDNLLKSDMPFFMPFNCIPTSTKLNLEYYDMNVFDIEKENFPSLGCVKKGKTETKSKDLFTFDTKKTTLYDMMKTEDKIKLNFLL